MSHPLQWHRIIAAAPGVASPVVFQPSTFRPSWGGRNNCIDILREDVEMYWRWLVYDVNTRGFLKGIEGFVLT